MNNHAANLEFTSRLAEEGARIAQKYFAFCDHIDKPAWLYEKSIQAKLGMVA